MHAEFRLFCRKVMKAQAFFAKAEQFESEYSMNQEKTGKLIRTLRLEKGLTQAELAAALCVSDKAVSKWERGCGSPDVGILPLLADTFNVSVEALLSGGSEKNRESNGNMKKNQSLSLPDMRECNFFNRRSRSQLLRQKAFAA